jgi:hypothetical protein
MAQDTRPERRLARLRKRLLDTLETGLDYIAEKLRESDPKQLLELMSKLERIATRVDRISRQQDKPAGSMLEEVQKLEQGDLDKPIDLGLPKEMSEPCVDCGKPSSITHNRGRICWHCYQNPKTPKTPQVDSTSYKGKNALACDMSDRISKVDPKYPEIVLAPSRPVSPPKPETMEERLARVCRERDASSGGVRVLDAGHPGDFSYATGWADGIPGSESVYSEATGTVTASAMAARQREAARERQNETIDHFFNRMGKEGKL